MKWLRPVLFFTVSLAMVESHAAPNTFENYLTTKPGLSRMLAYGDGNIAEIALASTPVLTSADIVRYDFATQRCM
jgi:hypothetical protein